MKLKCKVKLNAVTENVGHVYDDPYKTHVVNWRLVLST
jgi:hypothetical protein